MNNSMEIINDPEYQEHIIAFIDLLGFKEIIKKNDETDFLKVYSLLKSFADSKMDSDIHENGSITNFRPSINTFSDHVVISYPTKFAKGVPLDVLLSSLSRDIAHFAMLALCRGLLIRDGITIGKLYHNNSIVFGEALIDAFELESQNAIYPRIIVSNSVMASTKLLGCCIDFDGIYYLNYFNNVIPLILHSSTSISDWKSVAVA